MAITVGDKMDNWCAESSAVNGGCVSKHMPRIDPTCLAYVIQVSASNAAS